MEEKNTKKQKGLIGVLIAIIVVLLIFIANQDSNQNSKAVLGKSSEAEQSETGSRNRIEEQNVNKSFPQQNKEDKKEETVENNSYFEIVDAGGYSDILSDRIIILKVLGKQDVTCEMSIIAYDNNGNILDKATDSIPLTEGEYNYFRFIFHNDISAGDCDISYSIIRDSFTTGTRSAVEMVQYNVNGNYLYVKLKQVKERLGTFSQFKILLYKNGKIVGEKSGYFSVYADELDGLGSTAIAELSVYGEDFDRIEYMFEP